MSLNAILIGFIWIIPFVFMLMIGQWGLIAVDPVTVTNYTNLLETVTVWIAAIFCYISSSVYKPGDDNRKTWQFIGFGTLFWSIGQLILAFFDGLVAMTPELVNTLTILSDVFFILSIPFIMIGFYYLSRSFKVTIPLYGWIIGAIVLIGTLIISVVNNWGLVFPATPETALAIDRLIFTILYALLYPIMLSYAVIMASALFTGILGRPWIFVLVGFITYSIGEILWNYMLELNLYVAGGYVDLLWLVGFMLIGIGAYINYYMVKNPY